MRLTKEQRLDIYKQMLRLFIKKDNIFYQECRTYPITGFCYMLQYRISNYVDLSKLTELKKYKPEKLYQGYWFPIDVTKPNPRIKILKKIIKEMVRKAVTE